MDHCTRKLLGLTEEWLETKEEEGFRTNLIHAKLTYTPSHCRKCGIKNEGQIIKNGSHKTKVQLVPYRATKTEHDWCVLAFTVKNVKRHSMLKQIWWMKTAISQRN